jgi:replicative DNA helicase
MGLSGLVQESLLALLLYDNSSGRRVVGLIQLDLWDGPYQAVASQAYDYWTSFSVPPGEHALDLFERAASGNTRYKEQLGRIWQSIQETRGDINADYVLGQVRAFVREQRLRSGIIEAVDRIEEGDLTAAETAIRQSLDGVLDVFEPGLVLSTVDVSNLLVDRRQAIPTGIPEIDARALGPAVGELHLFIAPPGYGKSWWFIQLSKLALANRRRVVYVTLELSEYQVALRLLQSLFGVAKRRETIVNRVFEENELGQMIGVTDVLIDDLKTLEDKDIAPVLTRRLRGLERRSPLVIKRFPTGGLSVPELRAYLESLELSHRIVPDLLIIDYADLMYLGSRDYRHELGKLYKDLRGLAVERNIALATASQANRGSLEQRTITGRGVAEDWSKIATSDVVLTYSRTPAEGLLGTARIYVDKGRTDEDKFTVLITQNYRTGQFCLSSARMVGYRYWELVGQYDSEKRNT